METPSLPSPSIKKVALTYGALLALLSIALMSLSFVLDAHIDRPWWLSLVQFLISVVVIIMGISVFRKEQQGFLTLGEALKTGVAISLVAGIITILFNYIFINYIDPDFTAKALALQREQMEQQGKMTSEQIDEYMAMSAKFMSFWLMSAFTILFTVFFGFIISMVAGLFMRRDKPPIF